MRLKNKVSIYSKGQWDAFDKMLTMLNGLDIPDEMTADQMRRRIYGIVMDFRPATGEIE